METKKNNNRKIINCLEDTLSQSYQRCANIDPIKWINLLFLLNSHIKEICVQQVW